MANVNLEKGWKVTVTLLERAARALPAPPKEQEQAFANLLSEYRELLAHDELGLAFDALERLGHLVTCRGGFWRDLERAAENMVLVDRLPAIRKAFCDALTQSALRVITK